MKFLFWTVLSLMCIHLADTTEVTDMNDGTAVIIGHGKVLPDGVTVRLIKWDDGHGEYVATDTIENGQFKFEIPLGEGLTMGSIIFDYYAFHNMIHWLYLTPGASVEIDASDQYMYTWPVKSNVPEQDEYELYVNNSRNLWIEYQTTRMEYTKSRIPYDTCIQKTDSLNGLIYRRNLELLKTRPIGTVWMDKAIEFAKYSKIISEDLNVMYSNLDDSLKNSSKGRALNGYLYPGSPVGLGDKVPDLEFYDLYGNTHSFLEFYGKWILIDFWNSGCAPCIRALPELHELKEKYPDTFDVVSLSLDSENVWRESSEMFHLTGNNWNERKKDYGLFRRMRLNSYPTFMIVALDGTIKDIWSGYGAGELKQKVSFYLSPQDKTE